MVVVHLCWVPCRGWMEVNVQVCPNEWQCLLHAQITSLSKIQLTPTTCFLSHDRPQLHLRPIQPIYFVFGWSKFLSCVPNWGFSSFKKGIDSIFLVNFLLVETEFFFYTLNSRYNVKTVNISLYKIGNNQCLHDFSSCLFN
jgi:hypothetical protein